MDLVCERVLRCNEHIIEETRLRWRDIGEPAGTTSVILIVLHVIALVCSPTHVDLVGSVPKGCEVVDEDQEEV